MIIWVTCLDGNRSFIQGFCSLNTWAGKYIIYSSQSQSQTSNPSIFEAEGTHFCIIKELDN